MGDCLFCGYIVILPAVLGFVTKWPRWAAALVAGIGYVALGYGMVWLGLWEPQGPIRIPWLTMIVSFWPCVAMGRWLAQRRAGREAPGQTN